VAPTAWENASISPAIATTVESPSRAANSALLRLVRALLRFVRVPPAIARTGMILAPHRRLVAQKIHRPTGLFLRSLGGILTHLAGQQVSRAGRWSLTKPRPPPRKRPIGESIT
jgi:hypothetical protein